MEGSVLLEDRIIEFGKYKGSTYKDILVNQRDYCLWMIKQTWCRARYPLLYNYIVGNTSNAQPPEKVIPEILC